jgi:hypothetical protein
VRDSRDNSQLCCRSELPLRENFCRTLRVGQYENVSRLNRVTVCPAHGSSDIATLAVLRAGSLQDRRLSLLHLVLSAAENSDSGGSGFAIDFVELLMKGRVYKLPTQTAKPQSLEPRTQEPARGIRMRKLAALALISHEKPGPHLASGSFESVD